MQSRSSNYSFLLFSSANNARLVQVSLCPPVQTLQVGAASPLATLLLPSHPAPCSAQGLPSHQVFLPRQHNVSCTLLEGQQRNPANLLHFVPRWQQMCSLLVCQRCRFFLSTLFTLVVLLSNGPNGKASNQPTN